MSLIQKKTEVQTNPKKMLVFAFPKVGKTTAVAGLKNALIVDLEDGSGFITGDVVNVLQIAGERIGTKPKEVLSHPDGPMECIKIIQELHSELSKREKPYDYIITDSVTALVKIATYLGSEMYKKSPVGKNYTGRDVVQDLPNGGGYEWLRQAYEKILSIIEPFAHICAIEVGHVKDASIMKNGSDVSARDIQLPGKLKMILCQNADAVGYMSRRDGNKTMLSFKTDERDLATGARAPHLRNQEFVVVEENPANSGQFTFSWDKIFKDAA